MKRDFGTSVLLLIFGLPVFLLLFIFSIYFANCGFSADCSGAGLPAKIHTPIPTLIPATMPAPQGLNVVPGSMVSSGGSSLTAQAGDILVESSWQPQRYNEIWLIPRPAQ
jgi:hypothetical protein